MGAFTGVAGLLVGAASVVGHVYPFYMKFKGGMILVYNPWMFPGLLVGGIILVLIINYGIAMPMSVSVPFPVLVAFTPRDPVAVKKSYKKAVRMRKKTTFLKKS